MNKKAPLAKNSESPLDAVEKELVDHLVPCARELARIGADFGLALRGPWRLTAFYKK